MIRIYTQRKYKQITYSINAQISGFQKCCFMRLCALLSVLVKYQL